MTILKWKSKETHKFRFHVTLLIQLCKISKGSDSLSGKIFCVKISLDWLKQDYWQGNFVRSEGDDDTVNIWNISRYFHLKLLHTETSAVRSLLFDMACENKDGNVVRLWFSCWEEHWKYLYSQFRISLAGITVSDNSTLQIHIQFFFNLEAPYFLCYCNYWTRELNFWRGLSISLPPLEISFHTQSIFISSDYH